MRQVSGKRDDGVVTKLLVDVPSYQTMVNRKNMKGGGGGGTPAVHSSHNSHTMINLKVDMGNGSNNKTDRMTSLFGN